MEINRKVIDDFQEKVVNHPEVSRLLFPSFPGISQRKCRVSGLLEGGPEDGLRSW